MYIYGETISWSLCVGRMGGMGCSVSLAWVALAVARAGGLTGAWWRVVGPAWGIGRGNFGVGYCNV